MLGAADLPRDPAGRGALLAGARTLLLVGTAANGAVLSTAFAACARGHTVAVAVDAIRSEDPAALA